MRFGATPQEWITFDVLLGLTEDLLPVVSNPTAEISSLSTMKDKGKIPSKYNGGRKVVGLPDWTGFKASSEDIDVWLHEDDYGICLQTRHVRALDVDVPDITKAQEIHEFIRAFLKISLPRRYRNNSGKFLTAFRMPGMFAKRILRVDGGIIEFLANGQQFIAIGTHPSGSRYEWEDLKDFPQLNSSQFEELWTMLVLLFGTANSNERTLRNRRDTVEMEDEILDKLTVLGWGSQGQAHIECPFKNEHTSDSGISSTSYFPRGTQGYEQGHFVCLHAHCADRNNEAFMDALGLRLDGFELVVPVKKSAKPWPNFRRTKSGEIYPTVDNLYYALRRDDVCSAKLAFDRFRDEVVLTSDSAPAPEWRTLGDNDYTLIQIHLENKIGFKPIAIDLLRRAIHAVAYENSFDSAIVWLESLKWDGVPRVDRFLADYMACENSAYARAVSRYMWTALAGRTLSPGIKADMMPIFVSRQGTLKSSTIAALSPSPDYFCKISFSESDDNLSRKIRGRLIAEVAELRGFLTKEIEAIKDFISSTQETWVPKWKEHTTTFPRRLVFIGTTNHEEILGDETGDRRWLPIAVERADLESIKRDRDMLWAEARGVFRKEGICFEEAERLALGIHGDYRVSDPWESVINEWLTTIDGLSNTLPLDKGYITLPEVMREALRIEAKNLRGVDGKRVARILRLQNYQRIKRRMAGKIEWVWMPPSVEQVA